MKLRPRAEVTMWDVTRKAGIVGWAFALRRGVSNDPCGCSYYKVSGDVNPNEKEIFEEYGSQGRSQAWLYQQIVAHSRRAILEKQRERNAGK